MLEHITSQIKHEDEKLAVIAQQTQIESKRVKVLSTIATVYLPASLIAVRTPLAPKLQETHFH